jgi:hypothetical protein
MEDADGILLISEGSILQMDKISKNLTTMKDEELEALDRKELGTIGFILEVSVAFNISK